MLTKLRSVGFGLLILLGFCALLGLCQVLLDHVMLLWAGLAICSLAFSLLLLYLALFPHSYRY